MALVRPFGSDGRVRGERVHLCRRAAIPDCFERGSGRIVITGSGAFPAPLHTAYPASKAAVRSYGETLRWRVVAPPRPKHC